MLQTAIFRMARIGLALLTFIVSTKDVVLFIVITVLCSYFEIDEPFLGADSRALRAISNYN
jgi:hypothetical protein